MSKTDDTDDTTYRFHCADCKRTWEQDRNENLFPRCPGCWNRNVNPVRKRAVIDF